MKKLTSIIAMAMALSIGLWTINPAQSNAESFGSKAGIRASSHVSGVVIGKPMRNSQGVVLGTVENIVLNDNGCAQYVILSGKFSGGRSRLYPIPWTVIARTGPDAIFVDLDPAMLADAPSFEGNRWPDFSQTEWRGRVQNFYQRKAEVTAPSAVRSEDKAKVEKNAKTKQREWGNQAAQGSGSPQEKVKNKGPMERELKHKPSEMGTQGAIEPPKHKEMDMKMKQRQPGTPGMMDNGQTQMMQRGGSEAEKAPKKTGPSHVGVPGEVGQQSDRPK